MTKPTLKLQTSQIHFGIPKNLTFESKVLIITEKNIAPLYLQNLIDSIQAQSVFSLILEGGEGEKNLGVIEKILSFAFECKLDRYSTMIALGGGVISDIVGLASGLYMRGIEFCNIPTTLLAQVDASVGGKCGVNTQEGKNLIGLFHHPRQVFISPHFLDSLPIREFNAGMAEVIKMAICFSPELFERLFDKQWVRDNLCEVIYQSICIKAKVVRNDEKERGIRSALNYGHTFGHAIEKDRGFGTLLHGEAVSIGMVMANALAHKLTGFADSKLVLSLLKLYNLPTTYKITDIKSFYKILLLDKKNQKKQIKFVLPKTIGSFDFFYPSSQEIFEILSEFAE